MATNLGSAYITVWPKIDASGWNSQINNALGTINVKTSGEKAGKGLGDGIKSGLTAMQVAIGNVIGNVVSAGLSKVTQNIDKAIARVDTLNQFPKVMANIGFSTEEAAAAQEKLADRIQGLPTKLQDIIGNTQQLALSLGDLGKATDVTIALNDGMLAFGASSDDVTEAVRQLNQMISAGKYDQQSWLSIQQRAPGYLDAVAQSILGEAANAGDLRTALNEGQVSTEQFLEAIVRCDEEGTGRFAAFRDMVKDSTGGIETSMNNADNAITTGLANMIQSFNGSSNNIAKAFDLIKLSIKGFFAALQPVAEVLGNMFGELMDSVNEEEITQFFTDLGTKVSEALEKAKPYLDNLLQFLKDLVSGEPEARAKFDHFVEGIKAAITTFIALKAAMAISSVVKSVGDGIGGLGKIFETLGKGAGDAGSSIKGIGGAVSSIGSVLTGLSGPVGIVIGVIGALASVFIYLWNTNEDFRNAVTEIWNNICEVAKVVWGAICDFFKGIYETVLKPVFDLIAKIFTALYEIWAPVLEALWNLVTTVWNGIFEFLGGMVDFIVGLFKDFGGTIKAVWEGIFNFLGGIVDFFRNLFGGISEAISGGIEGVAEWWRNGWQGIVDFFSGGLWDGVKNLWTGLWEFFWGKTTEEGEHVAGLWEDVWNGICAIFDWPLFQPLKDIWNGLWSFFWGTTDEEGNHTKGLWENVWDFICSFFDGDFFKPLRDAWSGIWSFFFGTTDEEGNKTKGLWENIWDGICGFFNGDFFKPLKDAWNGLWGFFFGTTSEEGEETKGLWGDIWGTICSWFDGDFWQPLKDGWDMLWTFFFGKETEEGDRVKSGWESTWDGISTWASDTWNGISTGWNDFWGGILGTHEEESSELNTNWHQGWDDMASGLGGWWSDVQNTCGEAWSNVTGGIEEGLNWIGGRWDEDWTAMVESTDKTWGNIEGSTDEVFQALGGIVQFGTDNMTAITTSANQAIHDDWTGAWDTISTRSGEVWDGLRSGWDDITGKIDEATGGALTNIRTAWDEGWGHVRQFAEDAWNAIDQKTGGALTSIREGISGALNNIGQWWSQTWGNIQSIFSGVWDSVVSGVTEGGSRILQYFADLPGNILNALGDLGNLLWQAGSSIMDGLRRGLEDAWRGVTDFVGGIAGWIQEHKGPVYYDAKLLIPAGTAIMGGLNEGLEKGMPDVKINVAKVNSTLGTGLDETKKSWNDAWQSMGDGFDRTWPSVLNAVQQGMDAIISQVRNLPQEIRNALGDVGGILYEAGRSIMIGLQNGINNQWGDIQNQVMQMGNWIRDNKGPKSYDLQLLVPAGNWIMQGLSTGLEEGMAEVRSTVAAINSELAFQPTSDYAPVSWASTGYAAEIGSLANAQVYRADNQQPVEVAQRQPVNTEVILEMDGRTFAKGAIGYIDEALGAESRRRARFMTR